MKEVHLIYKFDDAVDYLNYEFEVKRMRNNRFSLRAWSKQLGYETPSFVSHILRKERTLKIEVAKRFTSNLKLVGNEKKYFELLVLFKNSKTVEEKKLYIDLLDSLRPRKLQTQQNLSLEAFRIIADWYHTAILELVELSDFQSDASWISCKLNNEVSSQSIKKAIRRLLKLELLRVASNGRLYRVKENPILIENYIPSEAIRHFHKQMMEKANAAIENQSIEDRDIRGSMISIKSKDYAKIQEIIRNAHAEIVKYSCNQNGEELYQFNTQFFRITKKKENL